MRVNKTYWDFPHILIVFICCMGLMDATEIEKDQTKGPNNIQIMTDMNKAGDQKMFEPSKEWKVIQPGEAIPPGLHIRSNLQTGVNEAKLMDPNDAQSQDTKDSLPALVKEEESRGSATDQEEEKAAVNSAEDRLNRADVLEALKSFKEDMDDVKDKKVVEESLKAKFRSYDELKDDFAKMNMGVKTDQEIITQLVEEYNSSSISTERKKVILLDLEYYLHQIDNALIFADMGGIEMLIREFNRSGSEVGPVALHALASAVQSNTKVQIRALEADSLSVLINHLSLKPSIQLTNRITACISGIIRHFPIAQKRFVETGGLAALSQIFLQPDPQARKTRLKTLTLINDLLEEKKSHALNMDKKDPDQLEKKKQYDNVALETALVAHGWCDGIVDMFLEATSSNDHDLREKVLHAVTTQAGLCSSQLTSRGTTVKEHLAPLIREYAQLAKDEDEFFVAMVTMARELNKTIDHLMERHTEL